MCIDYVWEDYDTDKSGVLDKNETKRFIMDTIKEMGDGETFSDEDFNACFRQVDTDGSGEIDKQEMINFIKIVANTS